MAAFGDDDELLEEEFTAVDAIFGEDCAVNVAERTCTVWVPAKAATPSLELRIHAPLHYPSVEAPYVELHAPHLSDDQHESIMQELEDIFLPGEVAIFNMVELLRERESLWNIGGDVEALRTGGEDDLDDSVQADARDMSNSCPAVSTYTDSEQKLMETISGRIVSGDPYVERKSTFQAHVAPVSSVDEVRAMVAALLQDNKIRRASHNMMAYRIRVPSKGTFLQDSDDDGEAAAGGRLLHLLQVAGVEGVCVVVSRWFGGVLLGPSRFSIINNTARRLLVDEGYLVQQQKAGRRPRKG